MLISFKFQNFRSFKDGAHLSLIANKSDKSLQSSLLSASIGKRAKLSVLRAAAIYGANTAGKTNVLRAVDFMRDCVLFSPHWNPNAGIRLSQYVGFSGTHPSIFEVEFLSHGKRWRYGFSANRRFFESEWLVSYPLGRERVLFKRQSKLDDKGNHFTEVKFGESLAGDDRYLSSIEKRTKENTLFLSVAAQDNQDDARQAFGWFQQHIEVFSIDADFERHDATLTSEIASEDERFREALIGLLKIADPSIETIEILENDLSKFNDIFLTKNERMNEFMQYAVKYDVKVVHRTESGPITLQLSQESRGLRKLYSIALRLLTALEHGDLVIIDELEASIHPHLARLIIDLFQDPSVNKGGAQIIFTTHDTNLLDQTLLRRDQIWFVERGKCESHLYSLVDFSPRKDESLENGYLRGRYGAIPSLSARANWLSSVRATDNAA